MATYTNILGSLLLGSLVAVTGCGTDPNTNNTGGSGGSGGEGGGGSNALTLDELGQKLVELNCAKSVECNNAESTADCVATSNPPIGEVKPYVDNGTVIYRPENVAACLAVFGGLGFCSYSELSTAQASQEAFEKACTPVFQGTIADGADCFTDEQCVSQNCATDPACMMQCCPGKCAAPLPAAKVGESCAVADCESGAYCQLDMMGDPTTCAAQAAMGQPCTDFDGCKSPALCDIDFMTGMGTCNVPAAHDATCNPQSFFACDRFDDTCDATSKKCVTKGLVGADCSMVDCINYAFCDMATMKCVKKLAIGATCDKMDDNCDGNLLCLDTGTCGFESITECK